jgi:hypothetical protein
VNIRNVGKALSVIAMGALVPLVACGNDFDPGSRVTSLRVLAVRADVPYARPGEEVHLEALAFDPQEGTRTLTWGWTTCVNPAQSTPEGCLEQITIDTRAGRPPEFVIGVDLDTYVIRIPSDVLASLPEAGRAHATLGVVAIACPGTLRFGVGPLGYLCTDAGGRVLGTRDVIAGMKRIFLREHDRNENPVIASVTWDGAAWNEDDVKTVRACDGEPNEYDDCDGEKHTIAAWPAAGSVESGVDEHGTPFEEQIVAQYYATEGIFERDVRIGAAPETGWVARRPARGTIVTLWLVVRDNRGGMSWTSRRVRVW